ncbi:MAG: hypothetical protein WBH68_07060 [Erysipelotrichaceae bacterium]|jgi:hypothetical protein|nr:hypothetical protein [Bacillota bacterium]NLP21610.1 hypothetical protein [Erysipelotrichaceae bacterium]
MIQAKIKKILILLILLLLFGCSNDGTAKFNEVLDNMDGINNYSTTSVTSNKYVVEVDGVKEEIDSEVNEVYKTDGNIAYSNIKTTSSLGDDVVEEHYYKDGLYYIDNEYGKYIVEGSEINKLISINSSIIKDGVEKVTMKKSGDYYILDIIYSQEKQEELYSIYAMEFGLAIDDIKYKPYVFKLKVNDKVVEEETIIEYSYKGKTSINVYSKTVTTFTSYGNESLKLPNVDEYKLISGEIKEELPLKEKLVNELSYIQKGNKYELIFNENETYIFDFDLNNFTYKIGSESYTYNWVNELGTYGKCTFDFKKDSSFGICSEDDLENIKITKGYLEVELIQIDETIESLLKVGE